MQITPTRIPDVKLIEPKVFGDERGFFMETWNANLFKEAGINAEFVQDNHSSSVKHTLRGLHYQIQQPQGKLVRVSLGEVFDVAVDMRKSSPTFGQWVGEYLTADNKRMLWVPPGFAHGFYVVSDVAEFQYKCTDFYAPEYERALAWNDAKLAINWPVADHIDVLLSAKDASASDFSSAETYT